MVAQAATPAELPAPVSVEIAFAGRSNVGKSSLLNSLLNRRNFVRTSSTPGCTRRVGFYQVATADGARFMLVDLPGYGYAKRSKEERQRWQVLIERYLARPTLAVVVLLVDARRGVEEEEQELLELLDRLSMGRRVIEVLLVATKLDRLSASARKPALAEVEKRARRPVTGYSIKTPANRDELWNAIRSAASLAPSRGD